MCDRGQMEVRPRADGDLVACERLAEMVHAHDGYPVYLPGDLRSFLAVPDAIGAWVADEDDEVVGHVALHPARAGAVMDLATEKTGVPASRFGVVARLLASIRPLADWASVDPSWIAPRGMQHTSGSGRSSTSSTDMSRPYGSTRAKDGFVSDR